MFGIFNSSNNKRNSRDQQYKDKLDLMYFSDYKDPEKLAHIVLSKENSRIIWELILQDQDRIINNKQPYFKKKIEKTQKFNEQVNKEAQNNNMTALLQKYSQNPTNYQIRFQKILKQKILQNISLDPHRKQMWLIASGALYCIKQKNVGYYNALKNMNQFPDFYDTMIDKDVYRTFFEKSEKKLQIPLKNILLTYSRRNSSLGYCQGMNFIVGFLIKQGFDEEECFWILTHIIENIVQLDYYTTVQGIMVDKYVFEDILKAFNPQLHQHLLNLELDLSIFCTNWFICLFTNSLPTKAVQIVWDNLFHEGFLALIKAGIVILNQCSDHIIRKCNNFAEVIAFVDDQSKNMNAFDIFKNKINSIYLNKKLVNLMQQQRRNQLEIQEKSYQKRINSNQNSSIQHQNQLIQIKLQINSQLEESLKKIDCKPYYPACQHFLEVSKPKERDSCEYFAYKIIDDIKITNHNHFAFKNTKKQHNFTKQNNKKSQIFKNSKNSSFIKNNNNNCQDLFSEISPQLTEISTNNNSNNNNNFQENNFHDILIERQKHICLEFQKSQFKNNNNINKPEQKFRKKSIQNRKFSQDSKNHNIIKKKQSTRKCKSIDYKKLPKNILKKEILPQKQQQNAQKDQRLYQNMQEYSQKQIQYNIKNSHIKSTQNLLQVPSQNQLLQPINSNTNQSSILNITNQKITENNQNQDIYKQQILDMQKHMSNSNSVLFLKQLPRDKSSCFFELQEANQIPLNKYQSQIISTSNKINQSLIIEKNSIQNNYNFQDILQSQFNQQKKPLLSLQILNDLDIKN